MERSRNGVPSAPVIPRRYDLAGGHHLLQVKRAGVLVWQARAKAVAYQHLSLRTAKGTIP